MDVRYLREFITLVTDGGYASAARRLGMAHTTLYRHVCSMESELKESLVISTNPVQLTPAGKKVFERAGAVLSEYDRMLDELEGLRGQARGDVKVLDLTPQNDSMPLIARAIFAVSRRYPGIRTMLRGPAANFDVIESVQRGGLDIAFRYRWLGEGPAWDDWDPGLPDDLARVPLARMRFPLAFGVGPAHPLYAADSATLQDFARLGLIQPANRVFQDSNDAFTDFLHRAGVQPKLKYVETTGLMEMWLAGPGTNAFVLTDSMLPEQMMPPEFLKSVRVARPSDGPWWMEVYAVVRREGLSEAALTVLAVLDDELG